MYIDVYVSIKDIFSKKNLDRNTELARAVGVMMVRANLHFDNQSKQAVFLFFIAVFSKRNRKHVLHVSIELKKHSKKKTTTTKKQTFVYPRQYYSTSAIGAEQTTETNNSN